MLNGARPFFTRLLTPAGEALARTPITPNMVTVTGTVGLSASVLWGYPTGHLFWGTLVATFFVFTDMLDGVLARIKGTSGKFGAFLDSTMDRVADASVFSGLAAWFVLGGHSRLMAAVSLFCLVAGALVSYVKARAEGLGTTANVGIAERPERMVLTFVVTGLWGLGVPYILPAGLWILAVASVITLVQRIVAVHKGLAVPPPPADGQAPAENQAENQTGSAAAAQTIE
ncbi:MAG TPA: CDP-alcohol phosphatidyltransferase family protein [Streptosporangiaceae bacterium]|jgi:CDP-diacylglycerol--glycerol-3-phosphate 3-phosphatidyltransferase|nr:CDP-alcohol phosphatidyltransferase family protein [Streptosporangiaceae bacterium]